jgi:type I restriction enzyme, S subunit
VIVKRARIGDLLEIQRRTVTLEPTLEYREIGLRSFGRGVFHKDPVPGSVLGDKRVFHVMPGDLVLSNVFAWEGAIAIAGEAERGYIGSHRFMTWTARSTAIEPRFAFHYFSSDEGLKALGSALPGSAGRNRTLGVRGFEDLMIPLPDIAEQRAIADRLDAIAGSSSRHVALAPSSSDLLSIIRAVATRWDRDSHSSHRLGSIANVERGMSLRLDPESPVRAIGQASVRWNLLPELYKGVDETWASNVSSSKKSRIGELLINSTGDGTIGRAALVDENSQDLIVDSHVLRVTMNHRKDADLVRLFLWSPSGRQAIERLKGSTTTKQSELGIARVRELEVPHFSENQASHYRQEVGELFRASEKFDLLRAKSLGLAKALPQAARNAEFARLMS